VKLLAPLSNNALPAPVAFALGLAEVPAEGVAFVLGAVL